MAQQRSRPETFEPPYAAHTTIFPESWPDYASCLIGVQAEPGADPAPLQAKVEAALRSGPEPLHVERSTETDARGFTNELYAAYWREPADVEAWRESESVRSVFEADLSGPLGLWRETIVAPISNVDPSGLRDRHEWGVGRHVRQVWERYHGYYGSMRDRMPAGHDSSIEGDDAPLRDPEPVDSLGRRLIVRGQHNLCYIRGVFGWRQAREDEAKVFVDEMLPIYERGAHFLRDNPVETGCVCARVVREVQTDHDTGIDIETIAWFTSLKALEKWTHKHPTHGAIFGKIIDIAGRFDFKLELNLGHEVVVVPEGGAQMEYNNCHPYTGFLPHFPSEAA